jgi:hypothetical protein
VNVVRPCGKSINEILGYKDAFCEPAVHRPTREIRPRTEVLALRAAVGAEPTGAVEPGHADPCPDREPLASFTDFLDVADSLVPGDDRSAS